MCQWNQLLNNTIPWLVQRDATANRGLKCKSMICWQHVPCVPDQHPSSKVPHHGCALPKRSKWLVCKARLHYSAKSGPVHVVKRDALKNTHVRTQTNTDLHEATCFKALNKMATIIWSVRNFTSNPCNGMHLVKSNSLVHAEWYLVPSNMDEWTNIEHREVLLFLFF